MSGFLAALGVVFLAELGDKSQLLVLSLATRYSAASVLGGLALTTTVLMAASVAVGAGLSAALPARPLQLAAGVLFVAFAVWTLVHHEDDPVENTADDAARAPRSGVTSTALAVAVAELGDKTMLATVTLAATWGPVAVWAGASLGMVAAGSIAIVVGNRLGRHLPERPLRLASAALFALFGVLLIVAAA